MTPLKSFLMLTLGAFLLLVLINAALPAIFLLFSVPSFEIGSAPFWLIRWSNTARGSGIQFNIWLWFLIAILIGLFGLLIKRR
jgi:hypothetical protein